jgi:Fic-DOC domain mobile mystery protein B
LDGATLTDEDLHVGGDDAATNLSPEERIGLIPTWIVTRDDLNRAERANIAAGLRWAHRGRFDVLDPDSLFTLHRRMFGDVWRWAGKPRESEKNIGVADWWKVREYLHGLTGDIAAQVAAGTRPPDEIAVDFHYRIVAIHVFPNGNGRHARLSADLLAERLGREPFTWGQGNLIDQGETRAAYIAAVKAADAFDLNPLVGFARS